MGREPENFGSTLVVEEKIEENEGVGSKLSVAGKGQKSEDKLIQEEISQEGRVSLVSNIFSMGGGKCHNK